MSYRAFTSICEASMSLIPCPDCKQEVSDSARVCLKCGRVFQKSIFLTDLGFDGRLFILMIAAGVLIVAFNWPYGVHPIGLTLIFVSTLFLLLRSLK